MEEKRPIRFCFGLSPERGGGRGRILRWGFIAYCSILFLSQCPEVGWPLCVFSGIMLAVICLVPLFTWVYLEPEEIRAVRFGRTIQSIPVSQLQCICVAGTDSMDILCFSARKPEELAQRCPDNIRGCPSRGRSSNWYLVQLANKTYLRSKDEKVIWFPMDPWAEAAVCACYPEFSVLHWGAPPDRHTGPDRVCFGANQFRCAPEGIWLEEKGQWRVQMSAPEIRTILRYDEYHMGKFHCHHWIYLIISSQDVETLAAQAKYLPKWVDELPMAQEIRAIQGAARKMIYWTPKRRDYVTIALVPGVEAELRKLYPNARWVDLTA